MIEMGVCMSSKYLLIFFSLLFSCSAYAEKTDLKLTGQQGVHYFFTLSSPWVDDPIYIESVFRNFCSSKAICITHMWKTGEAKPAGFPLSDKEVARELATLQHNANTGRNELLWNCKRFKGKTLKNCF